MWRSAIIPGLLYQRRRLTRWHQKEVRMNGRLLLVAVLGLLVGACQRPAPERAAAAPDPLQGSYRFQRNGWIFVHLEGPPQRIGFQHGALLAPEIADLIRVQKPW